MPITLRDINLEAAVALAHRFKIYAYDAYILGCAIETQACLLTMDRKLKATARIGLTVYEISQ